MSLYDRVKTSLFISFCNKIMAKIFCHFQVQKEVDVGWIILYYICHSYIKVAWCLSVCTKESI